MTKSLSEIVSLVKQLRDEVGQQRNEISYLRQLIENCAGCQHNRRESLRESCQANNPCYPGMNVGGTANEQIQKSSFCSRDYLNKIFFIFSSFRGPVLRYLIWHQMRSLSTWIHRRWKTLQARSILLWVALFQVRLREIVFESGRRDSTNK